MPTEIEAKLRVDSHGPVRDRLRALGASLESRVLELNRIFDREDGSLRRRGCGLRVRSARDEDGFARHTMTFKGPRAKSELKVREELEVEVADAEAASRILLALGFSVVLSYGKRRETWRFQGCQIALDEPPALGLFLEIEGPDEATVERARTALGLDASPLVSDSYVEMLVRYCDKRGITDRTLDLP